MSQPGGESTVTTAVGLDDPGALVVIGLAVAIMAVVYWRQVLKVLAVVIVALLVVGAIVVATAADPAPAVPSPRSTGAPTARPHGPPNRSPTTGAGAQTTAR